MRKFVICTIALMLCTTVFCGCTLFMTPLPESGVWYCKELDMYLDVETSTGCFRNKNGEYEPLFYNVGFDQRYHINFCESQESEGYLENVKHVNMKTRYLNDVFWLTDEATGIEYKFVEVDRELYPGG